MFSDFAKVLLLVCINVLYTVDTYYSYYANVAVQEYSEVTFQLKVQLYQIKENKNVLRKIGENYRASNCDSGLNFIVFGSDNCR